MKTQYQHKLEKKIRKLLSKTDWMVANVESVFSAEQVEEIRAFRQGLRDCNKEYPLDATKWVMPEVPSCIRSVDLSD